MPQIRCSFLKCEWLLVFLLFYDYKFNIFVFWTVRQITFYRQNDLQVNQWWTTWKTNQKPWHLCCIDPVKTEWSPPWSGRIKRPHLSWAKTVFISHWKELGRILQQNTRLKQLPFHVTQYRKEDVVQSHV